MNGLLKAMLKGTKREAFTQVDEGELMWNPQTIYARSKEASIYPFATDLDNLAIAVNNRIMQ